MQVVIQVSDLKNAVTLANFITNVMNKRGIAAEMKGVQDTIDRDQIGLRVSNLAEKLESPLTVYIHDENLSDLLINDIENGIIVKGTFVTVKEIESLVIDGCTHSDILKLYPELNEDDIRACITYAVMHQDDGDEDGDSKTPSCKSEHRTKKVVGNNDGKVGNFNLHLKENYTGKEEYGTTSSSGRTY